MPYSPLLFPTAVVRQAQSVHDLFLFQEVFGHVKALLCLSTKLSGLARTGALCPPTSSPLGNRKLSCLIGACRIVLHLLELFCAGGRSSRSMYQFGCAPVPPFSTPGIPCASSDRMARCKLLTGRFANLYIAYIANLVAATVYNQEMAILMKTRRLADLPGLRQLSALLRSKVLQCPPFEEASSARPLSFRRRHPFPRQSCVMSMPSASGQLPPFAPSGKGIRTTCFQRGRLATNAKTSSSTAGIIMFIGNLHSAAARVKCLDAWKFCDAS